MIKECESFEYVLSFLLEILIIFFIQGCTWLFWHIWLLDHWNWDFLNNRHISNGSKCNGLILWAKSTSLNHPIFAYRYEWRRWRVTKWFGWRDVAKVNVDKVINHIIKEVLYKYDSFEENPIDMPNEGHSVVQDLLIWPCDNSNPVTIRTTNFESLSKGQCLICTMVDFYLKYQKRKYQYIKGLYFFNSFFFRKACDHPWGGGCKWIQENCIVVQGHQYLCL